MSSAVNERLSVVCVDGFTDKVIGAYLVRDFAFFPDGFKDKYKPSTGTKLAPWTQLFLSLSNRAETGCKELQGLSPGVAADLFILGVLPEHRGRGIATELVRFCVEMAKAAGFRIATLEATSHFTSDAAQCNGFKSVISIDCKKEDASFVNVTKPHDIWNFWVKDLTQDDIPTREKLCAE